MTSTETEISMIAPTGVDYEGLRTLQAYCHNQSRVRGFHELPDELKEHIAELRAQGRDRFADYLEDIETGNRQMLIVGELGEAHEQTRNGHADNEVYYSTGKNDNGTLRKPEGTPSEYGDTFIRLMDECGKAGIDIAAVVKEKLEYNASRAKYHGGVKF